MKGSVLLRNFLLVFNGSQINRRAVTTRIDSVAAIANWMAFFENAICLVSASSARELSDRLREVLPDVQFILTELETGRRNGWLPKSVWSFMRHPEAALSDAAE